MANRDGITRFNDNVAISKRLFIKQLIFELPHGKTNNLHRRAKTKAQISFAVTAKQISAFVFATLIVQFLFYLNPKFHASGSFL